MAPVYDVLSTVPYIPDDETAALRYSRTKKMTEFSRDELAHLAKALLPEKLVMDAARETVERFEEIWTVEKSHLPLDRKVMTRGRGPSRAGANLRRVPNSVIVQVLTGLKRIEQPNAFYECASAYGPKWLFRPTQKIRELPRSARSLFSRSWIDQRLHRLSVSPRLPIDGLLTVRCGCRTFL